MTLNLITREMSIDEFLSTSKKNLIQKKFTSDQMEVTMYNFLEDTRFFIDASKENGLKTYSIIEGMLKNVETSKELHCGDLLVVDHTQKTIHFDATKGTRIMVHALNNSAYDAYSIENSKLKHILTTIQERDSYTSIHCNNVYKLSSELGSRMGLLHNELYALDKAARFHDVGKVFIDDAILNKPGVLTADEYEAMKEHVAYGHELVCSHFTEEIYTIISYHHERLDGSGYPNGLKGDQIPLSGRILAVCDTFDAMTTDRVYKKAKTYKEAFAELRASAHLFDMKVVDVLEAYARETGML